MRMRIQERHGVTVKRNGSESWMSIDVVDAGGMLFLKFDPMAGEPVLSADEARFLARALIDAADRIDRKSSKEIFESVLAEAAKPPQGELEYEQSGRGV